MIATIVFGMGINIPDVHIVIHTGCDGLPAKAIIMYSRKDINRQPSIDANEEGGEKESIECTSREDLASRECNICDNCLHHASDNPVWVDI
ncbi:hypothetical protein RhiirA4_549833 [Rhizophagus irregularis]|uniref:Uncharacterized protein n=1 Tax=Rhizophagus irregularis TaxID=588596 RepID=A0A2I1HG47_9GLOM|nr:hypothetical protein RhiirA4_549833 [Rhizophagus irregularis]